jgi:hypothetical protein
LLAALRRVDSVQPNSHYPYVDRIAINDGCIARDKGGLSRGWLHRGRYGESRRS